VETRARTGWSNARVVPQLAIRGLVAVSVFVPVYANAQEIAVGAGAMQTPDSPQSSYAWHLDYRRRLGSRYAWSATWLNEGHVRGHHRDGVAAQMWAESRWPRLPVTLSLGLGVYHFFDTQQQADGDSQIQHAWSPIASLAATYYTTAPWFWRATINAITPVHGITVNTFTLALGYRLGAEPRPLRANPAAVPPSPTLASHPPSSEVSLLFGKSVVNASVGSRGIAATLEYRRKLAPHWEWTAAWIQEGDAVVIDRQGAATQVWLVDASHGRLTLGFGAGLYFNFDRDRPSDTSQYHCMGLLSPTVAWRLSEDWLARVIWHRVISDYHRDTDVFLLGAGRRW
jgi:hypothetical protein